MFSAFPLTTILSAFAGAKVRQLKRDAVLIAVIALMMVLASMSLLGAFAAFIAQSHGFVIGLLSAAALSIVLGLVALVVRAVVHRRAMRRQRLAATSAATVMAASSASNLIAQNKTMAIVAGVVIGAIAGSLVRSGRD
ncbi:MAG: hypothetical protein Q8S27_03635 [Hoeflea sp.]|uniref:hypothetical protein n=1 Tax=Hoeflea sp. TaxID=1940281 RepID=UPI0027322A27|nr:hypothetical protein [Hoeflea sp.]MDP2121869.1 hypothetical protein [Hoeflea sp.]MDP3523647.1 hypothetical protein [Hoeflea sp.]